MADDATRSAVGKPPAFTWRMRAVDLGDAPGLVADIMVAAGAVVLAVLARIAIEQVVGGVVPFTLTFPVVLAATLWAGARAGTITAVGCQLLTIRFVFPNWTAEHGGQPTDIANLVLSTGSLALMIWAVASYRRVSRQLRRQCEREVKTLSLMIGEMDHRTKNNFQIAAHLLSDQARTSESTDVARELGRAAGRLGSIASVYRNLMLVKDRSGAVGLGAYLADIVGLLRDGIVPQEVTIAVRSENIQVSAHSAMIIGLLVNEWIANAVKYAFPEGRGTIRVAAERSGSALVVTVADDGRGGAQIGSGNGSRLMDGLASTIDGSISVRRDGGTTCVLRVENG